MEKTRLLLIPGTQCNEKLWEYVTPLISDNFETLHWPIPMDTMENVLAQLHKQLLIQLEQIITGRPDSLSIEMNKPLIVLGFSLGGYVLARYLANYELRLKTWFAKNTDLASAEALPIKFLIVSHTPTALPDKELEQRRRILSVLHKNDYAGVTAPRVCQLLGANQHQNQELISLIQQMDESLGKESLIHQLTFTGQRVDSLNSINKSAETFDVSFVCTTSDPLVNYEWLQHLSSKVTVSIVKGEGHMLPLEYPSILSNELEKLLLR